MAHPVQSICALPSPAELPLARGMGAGAASLSACTREQQFALLFFATSVALRINPTPRMSKSKNIVCKPLQDF